jgi:hypothetical protein
MDTDRFSTRTNEDTEGIAKAEGHGDLDRLAGHSRLRCFTDAEGFFWLEQNARQAKPRPTMPSIEEAARAGDAAFLEMLQRSLDRPKRCR